MYILNFPKPLFVLSKIDKTMFVRSFAAVFLTETVAIYLFIANGELLNFIGALFGVIAVVFSIVLQWQQSQQGYKIGKLETELTDAKKDKNVVESRYMILHRQFEDYKIDSEKRYSLLAEMFAKYKSHNE